ncbi:NACHT domain-containing protein, partial [Leptolyngbya sp. FACHB-711]
MPSPSSQPPLFEQARQRFDLDRLRSDLERTGKITPRNWEYLKGILCELDQGEIAKHCSVTKGTVKTALTGRVRQQILELLPDKSEIDWKRLPQWLIEAGYGIGEGYPDDYWKEVCRAMLDRQIQSPTLEYLMAKDGVCIDPAKLFISVGLIERKQKQYRRSDVSSVEQGSQLLQPVEDEIVKRFDNEEIFLSEVICNSNTSDNSRLVITGEPGSGKTTLLQKIGDRLYLKGMFPIWISLGKCGVSPTFEFLSHLLKKNAKPRSVESSEWEASINALLQTGKVWLLLDGADELTTTGNSLQMIGEQLKEAWADRVKVVLTCRLNTWDVYALPRFKVFRTLAFDYQTPINKYRNQIEAYIYRFFTRDGVDSQLGDALIQQLYLPGKERIRDSVKNPLRLSLLCYIWESHIGELPDTKAELYRLFVDYYYDLQARKHSEVEIDRTERDTLNSALGEVAKTALDSHDSRFRLRKSQIEDISAMGKSDARGSLFYKAVQLGWLNYIGTTSEKPHEATYAFFHPTFQEYFAALAIDDWSFFLPQTHIDKPMKYGKYRIFEPQWKEVIGLWLGKFDLNDYFKEQL